MNLESKIKGSLVGKVWGDALGCPVETWKSNEIQRAYSQYTDLPTEYPFEKIKNVNQKYYKKLRPLGLHSDDGQQAMALLQVCLSPGGWSVQKWAKMLVEGMDKKAWRGYGQNFATAIQNMKKGTYPQYAGSESAGIGTAMRITSLGGLYYDDIKRLRQITLESSLVTHGDIRAAAFTYGVSFAIAKLIQGEPAHEVAKQLPQAIFEAEKEMLTIYKAWKIDKSAGHLVSETLSQLFEQDINNLALMRSEITRLAKPHLKEGHSLGHPNQGYVLLGGFHSLVMALQDQLSPHEALISLIQQGYDTDTVAAISGGLLGARYGLDWIPLDKIYDKDRVLHYADCMISKQQPEDQKTFIQKEAALTRAEKEYQQTL